MYSIRGRDRVRILIDEIHVYLKTSKKVVQWYLINKNTTDSSSPDAKKPLVDIFASNGKNFLRKVVKAIETKTPVVFVKGTGTITDDMAAFVKACQQQTDKSGSMAHIIEFFKDEQRFI